MSVGHLHSRARDHDFRTSPAPVAVVAVGGGGGAAAVAVAAVVGAAAAAAAVEDATCCFVAHMYYTLLLLLSQRVDFCFPFLWLLSVLISLFFQIFFPSRGKRTAYSICNSSFSFCLFISS